MPLDRRAGFQLGLLLLAVPAQFLVAKYLSNTQTQRSYALHSLIKSATGFRNQYLSWNAWQQWCKDLIHQVKSFHKDGWAHRDFHGGDDEGESPAVEVMRYKDPEGYFAGSPEPRSPRPPEVKYRIGQVIKHKRWGYRGVIIGWDTEARAPEQWIRQMHPPDKPHWRKQPNYSILVDTRDRLDAQTTYVPQENIDIIVNTQIYHPEIDNHFETFDGAQYIARPWLKALYPHDQ